MFTSSAAAEGASGADRADPSTRPSSAVPADTWCKAIALAQADEDLLPILAPLAVRLGGKSGPAALVVWAADFPARPGPPLGLVDPRGRYAVRRAATAVHTSAWLGRQGTPIVLAENGTRLAVEIAARFWPKAGQAILASTSDPRASVHAAALAAHLGVPFLPVGVEEGAAGVDPIRRSLPGARLLFVGAPADAAVLAPAGGAAKLEILSAAQASDRLVRVVGPEKVRTILVARAPDPAHGLGRLAWLAPHLSVVRNGAIVLSETGQPEDVERRVEDLIRRHRLRPRSVTLLGDYTALPSSTIKDQGLLGEYQVTVEPCSGGIGRTAAAWGVGRIPCDTTSQASLLLAAGQIRQRLPGRAPGQVLLVANPNSQYGALPLAETVARLKAEELRNLGMGVMAHFGQLPARAVLEAEAGKADVIVYEGHIVDEPLFRPKAVYAASAVEPVAETAGGGVVPAAGDRGEFPINMPLEATNIWGGGYPPPIPEVAAPGDVAAPLGLTAAAAGPAAPRVELGGMALVVLQSCHSLEEPTLRNIAASGGSGLVGSVTSVHSASGSAIMKAFLDAAVRPGATAGEALRDARNYFLCLDLLKAQRGHKEHAKVRRVALTFQLWGDPEMPVFGAGAAGKAQREAPSASFAGYGTLSVRVPRRRLPEAKTERYVARVFAGSQVAGIVRRVKGKPHRRLAPTYYFRLPISESFRKQSYLELMPDESQGGHAVFLTDSAGRFVNVLYFPQKESPGATFRLRFK